MEEMEKVWVVTVRTRDDSTYEPMPCMVFADEDIAKDWVKQHNKDSGLLWYQVTGRIFLNRQILVEQDSWEKLREDARKSHVDYWGCKGDTCEECPALIDGLSPSDRYDTTHCVAAGRLDILARAEKLARVSADE